MANDAITMSKEKEIAIKWTNEFKWTTTKYDINLNYYFINIGMLKYTPAEYTTHNVKFLNFFLFVLYLSITLILIDRKTIE